MTTDKTILKRVLASFVRHHTMVQPKTMRTYKRLLRNLKDRKWHKVSDLVETMNTPAQTIRMCLRRLLDQGIVTKQIHLQDTRRKVYRLITPGIPDQFKSPRGGYTHTKGDLEK